MTDMLDLMKSDPKLKVVLKEFPVLGPGSVEAAQVAVAVRMQDPTGKKYLDFHQKLLGGRGQADKARAMAAAKEAGLDMAQARKGHGERRKCSATLEENFKLAEEMGMNGTPSYVIGQQVVVGAVGIDSSRKRSASRDAARRPADPIVDSFRENSKAGYKPAFFCVDRCIAPLFSTPVP